MHRILTSRSLALSVAMAALVVFASAMTAKADIVVLTSVDNTGTDNVLLNTATNVTVVTGTVGPDNLVVNFTSTGGTLSAPASGQARVTGGTGNAPYTQLSFSLDNGGTFTNAVFNINAETNGSVQITVEGINITGGTFVNTFTVDANGENFFTVHAINGQLITKISLLGINGATFEDTRQIRLGGFGQPEVIPEPTTMILLGSGLIGVAASLRRRKKK